MKLGMRVTIIFFSIIFISLTFLDLVLYKNTERLVTHATLDKIKTIADLIKVRVQDGYSRYSENLKSFSSRVSLYEALDEYFADPTFENISKVETVLRSFIPVKEGLQNVYVFDLQGNLIAGTTPLWLGRNASDERFFKEGLKGEFNGFKKRNENDKYTGQLFISGPIKPKEKAIGVILILLNNDFLADIAGTYQSIGETEDVLLGHQNSNGDAMFITPRRFENDEAALQVIPKDRSDIPIVQALAGEEKVFDRAIDYRGHEVLATTRYIKEINVGLVVKIDRNEFLQYLKDLNKVSILFGGIIVFFTLLIAFIIARSLSRPIERLSRVADQVASGDLDAESFLGESIENDEVALLGNSLKVMSDKLITANRNLESDVRAKTKELEQRLVELERLMKITSGRELRMIELKKKINQLSKELNLKEPYDLSFIDPKKT